MWGEPEFLVDAPASARKLEADLCSGKRKVPGRYLNVGLSGLIRPLEPRIDNMLALRHEAFRSGVKLVPMLTPGPRDVSFVLTKHPCPMQDILKFLGHWDLPTVVLVLKGAIYLSFQFKLEGCLFLQEQSILPSYLTVIPAEDQRSISIRSESVLLVASPGRQFDSMDYTTAVDFSEYLGHVTMTQDQLTPQTWRRLRQRDDQGNSIGLHHHKGAKPIGAPGGVMTLAVHVDQEAPELESTPDLLLIPPQVTKPSPPTLWSMDVCLS